MAVEHKAIIIQDGDMTEGKLYQVPNGAVGVFSARCPDRQPPNQDSAAIIPVNSDCCVLAVADGVGGSRSGAQASQLAVESLVKAIEKHEGDSSNIRTSIVDGFDAANRSVCELGVGAATTLTAVEINGKTIRTYQVGDSLALAVGQRGKVKAQTNSHSTVGYGVTAGFVEAEDAIYHDQLHEVLNFIGTADMRLEIGTPRVLSPRDTLLLSTDGLADNMHLEEIINQVRKGPTEQAVTSLANCCTTRMALNSGSTPHKPDDVTFLVFRSSL